MKYVQFECKYFFYPFSSSVLFFLFIFTSVIIDQFEFNQMFFCLTFPLLFSIFPEIITQLNMKSDEVKQSRKTPKIIPNNQQKMARVYTVPPAFKKYFLIIFLGLCRFTSDYLLRYFTNMQFQGYTMILLYCGLILIWVLSFIVSKEKFKRHHIFSVIVLTITFLVEVILFSKGLEKAIRTNFSLWYLYIIISFFYLVAISFKEVTENHLMQNYFLSPYILLFYEGILSLIFWVIFLFVINFIPCLYFGPIENVCNLGRWSSLRYYFKYTFNYARVDTVYAWLFCIVVFVFNIVRLQTNHKLTPIHRYLSEYMANVYFIIFQLIRSALRKKINRTKPDLIISLFMELVGLIAYLVFNEVIILYVFQLHKETHREINARALEDVNLMANLTILGELPLVH